MLAAPGFRFLSDKDALAPYHLVIELGSEKNINKNPVAERAIQELRTEATKLDPMGGPLTNTALTIALDPLNSRIRSRGLSAREMLHRRDQYTEDIILVEDTELADIQNRN